MSLSKRFLQMVNATIKAVDPSSAIGIAEGQPFSHDSVYRILCAGKHCFTILAFNRVKSINGFKGGYLVLDDSFIIRFSSGKLNLKKIKNSTTGQFAYGFNVVLLIWTNGTIRIPIGYRVFLVQPGQTSKIDLALEMLNEAKQLGLHPKAVLFDAWYAAESILNYLEGVAWKFVTRLRKNRLLNNVSVSSDRRVYWVKVGRLQKMRSDVVVARHQRQYLVSNDLSLTRTAMRRLYRIRQNVEEVFRSLKQELGWEGFRFRTVGTLDAFMGLTLSGYAVIEVARAECKLSFYKFRAGLISGRLNVPDIVIDKLFATA
jgi:putative transposase